MSEHSLYPTDDGQIITTAELLSHTDESIAIRGHNEVLEGSKSSIRESSYPLGLGNASNNFEGNGDASHSLGQTQQQRQRRRWALTLYSITTILLFADQNLMSPNLSAMAKEFHFTDLERDQKLGGDIALAFWMTGVPATILMGCLADRYNRSILFALTVGIGEGACLVTYFSRTYWQLYICRAVTGFSMGGGLPLIYSVLGDFFRAEERHGVTALVAMGTGIGISLGQGIAGFLGPVYGWRLPFLVVSLPALVVAAIVLITVRDPARGGMEKAFLDNSSNRHGRKTNTGNTQWTSLSQDDDESEGHTLPQVELTTLRCVNDQNESMEESVVELPSARPFHDQPTEYRDNATHLKANVDGVALKRRSHDGGEHHQAQQLDNSYRVYTESANGADNERFGHHALEMKGGTWSSLFQTFCSLLFSSRTVLLALLQGAPGCVPWGIVNTYLNDFLSDDRGMTVEFATFTLLWFGFGTFLGMMVGGAGGNYLYTLDSRYPALLSGSSAIVGCIPFWFLLNFIDSDSSFLLVATTTLLAGIGSGVTGPIVKATLQNVTLPTTRGQAFALANTFDDFGRGLGPVFVAMLIKSTGGRTEAFNIGVIGWVVCGALNLLMFITVTRDEQKVQETMIEMLNLNNNGMLVDCQTPSSGDSDDT